MTALRVLKALTVCAFLVLITTARGVSIQYQRLHPNSYQPPRELW
jgi:hypothetical protein